LPFPVFPALHCVIVCAVFTFFVHIL
jgi:hypothetical protein